MKRQIIIYHKSISLVCFMAICFATKAQEVTKLIQASVQVSRPTSALLEVTSIGYGAALKGMYGFGSDNQQVTLEGGYNRFPVKKLPANIQAYYSAVPIYAGYRYIIKRYTLEAQAGISLNRIIGRNTMRSMSRNETDFGWALAVGYLLKNFEVGLRYHNSDVKNTEDNLTFLGIRMAYNIKL
ncbi:Outer membrane protein beta-barrel domain-containing protein [Pedobacter sp. ok626]|uniref:outer membrane beta-barrel protein n=1 Tax=Pedobacter sp. ok626 TaxID=1761882 RepID=UPI00088F47A5|nr:outer membrane beta-barrel protein [Pedobacter sp. ok626]SDK56805.1 Outer membrane protein beta-barrel domain-containing protein [Pedobacter sp. ok626]